MEQNCLIRRNKKILFFLYHIHFLGRLSQYTETFVFTELTSGFYIERTNGYQGESLYSLGFKGNKDLSFANKIYFVRIQKMGYLYFYLLRTQWHKNR